jgi:hypothetical protein
VFGQSTCQLPACSPHRPACLCVSRAHISGNRRRKSSRSAKKKKSRSAFLLIATCWPAEHGGRGGMAAGHHINVRLGQGFRESRKDFNRGRPPALFRPFVPGAAARPGTASGMLNRIKGVGTGRAVWSWREADGLLDHRICQKRKKPLPASGPAPATNWYQAMTRRWPRVALRWKNRAWLTTADTVAGWNGFAIRKAGSGRWPVRKRSG